MSDAIKVKPCAKRVRPYVGGKAVADSTDLVLVWEVWYAPVYYFPLEKVRTELFVGDGTPIHSEIHGDGLAFDIEVNGKRAEGAALRYDNSPVTEVHGRVSFKWDAMDAWFEEDEEVFTHVRDPYHRVDILPSSRQVRVEIDGVTVAESSSPRVLFETSLPERFYLPKTHVRMDLLVPSDMVTHCAYKGQAQYWSARIGDKLHKDVAWSYATPLPEAQKIAGHIAFLNERIGHYIDGELQKQPVSEFS